MQRTKQEARADAQAVADLVGGFQRVSVHVGTWMGRPGESWEFGLTSSRMGERVVVMAWHDGDDLIDVSRIKGDGRTRNAPDTKFAVLATDSVHGEVSDHELMGAAVASVTS